MQSILSNITTLVAIFSIVTILITCIAKDINGGIIYTGLALLSGLGGYTLGRVRTEKIYRKKQKPNNSSQS